MTPDQPTTELEITEQDITIEDGRVVIDIAGYTISQKIKTHILKALEQAKELNNGDDTKFTCLYSTYQKLQSQSKQLQEIRESLPIIIKDFLIEFYGYIEDNTAKQGLKELLEEWLPKELSKILGQDLK